MRELASCWTPPQNCRLSNQNGKDCRARPSHWPQRCLCPAQYTDKKYPCIDELCGRYFNPPVTPVRQFLAPWIWWSTKFLSSLKTWGKHRGSELACVANGQATNEQREKLIELTVALQLNSTAVKSAYNSGAAANEETSQVLGSQATAAISAVDQFVSSKLKLKEGRL